MTLYMSLASEMPVVYVIECKYSSVDIRWILLFFNVTYIDRYTSCELWHNIILRDRTSNLNTNVLLTFFEKFVCGVVVMKKIHEWENIIIVKIRRAITVLRSNRYRSKCHSLTWTTDLDKQACVWFFSISQIRWNSWALETSWQNENNFNNMHMQITYYDYNILIISTYRTYVNIYFNIIIKFAIRYSCILLYHRISSWV